jgi:hypothetical protein
VFISRTSELRDFPAGRAAARDLVEQVMAVDEPAARCPGGSDLEHRMLGLRNWAVWYLDQLADSAVQAIVIGERPLADRERVLGPDHPGTLSSRNNLAAAYRAAGRTGEATKLTP